MSQPQYVLTLTVGSWQFGSPAVGLDGTIYCTPTGASFDQILKAYTLDGWELWQKYFLKTSLRRPAVSSDGTVYVAAVSTASGPQQAELYALDKFGAVRWEYRYQPPGAGTAETGLFPVCDAAGAVYVVFGRNLNKFSSEGEILWALPIQSSSEAVLANYGDTLYLLDGSGWSSCLRAISIEGEELWSQKAPFDAKVIEQGLRDSYALKHGSEAAKYVAFAINFCPPSFQGVPKLGPTGSVYAVNFDGSLYAFFADGTPQWSLPLSLPFDAKLAVGADESIYIASTKGLHCVSAEGKLQWQAEGFFKTEPAVGQRGQIYVAEMQSLHAFDSNGSLLWKQTISGVPGKFLALTPDDRVCVSTDSGCVYVVG